MANQFYNSKSSEALDVSSVRSSDTYANGSSVVGTENDNRDAENQNRRDYLNSEGLVAAITDDRIEGEISSMNQAADWAYSDKYDKGYRTDLGAFMNFKNNIMMKDLGQLMTDRMKKSLSKDDVHQYGIIGLAYDSRISQDVNLSRATGNAISTETPGNLYIQTNDTYKEIDSGFIKEMMLVGGNSYDGALPKDGNSTPTTGEIASPFDNLESYMNAAKLKGLGMGQSKVLNPDFQFNELDDVRSDIRQPMIGRIYGERIYDFNLPVLYLHPGTVKINTSLGRNLNALHNHSDMTNFLKDGNFTSKAMNLGATMVNGVLAGKDWILSKGMWYKWEYAFSQYVNYVNDMLIELAVWMGLFDETSSEDIKNGLISEYISDPEEFAKKYGNIDAADPDKAIEDFITASGGGSGNVYDDTGVSSVDGYIGGAGKDKRDSFRLDINHILPSLYPFTRDGNSLFKSKDKKVNGTDPVTSNDTGWNLMRMTVPYALNKAVTVSESFSNQLDTHPLVGVFGSAYESSNESNLKGHWGTLQDYTSGAKEMSGNAITKLMDGDKMGALTDTVGGLFNKQMERMGAMATAFGFGGSKLNAEVGMIIKGQGRFMLPKVWTDSTYTRSYSINLKFKSPYGDRLSIFENTFVPLMFLIGMTSPRQAGMSSYTTPFYVKAYSKGLVSCEMGMITSLNINRGEDKNDRTYDGFFRSISVSVTLEDVLPTLMMSLDSGIGVFRALKSTNTGMRNYLSGLANIDFVDRQATAPKLKKLKHMMNANLANIGMNVRAALVNNTGLGKAITYVKLSSGSINKSAIYNSAGVYHDSY